MFSELEVRCSAGLSPSTLIFEYYMCTIFPPKMSIFQKLFGFSNSVSDHFRSEFKLSGQFRYVECIVQKDKIKFVYILARRILVYLT
jgi:hypothetical protein